MITEKEYEDAVSQLEYETGYQLDPIYLQNELTWGIKLTKQWPTKEDAQGFIEYLKKRRLK